MVELMQRADEVTQFCHLLHADDAAAAAADAVRSDDTDRRQDLSPTVSSTAQRVDKVLDELAFTEQQYVKVRL